MKTLITAATFAALALGATAAQASVNMSAIDREAVQRIAPGASLSNLSAEQVRALSNFVSAPDHAARPGAQDYVRHILSRG